MARIMCTQKLWRRLGQLGRPPSDIVAPPIHGASLGSWGAKVFRHQRRDLVVGVNERTYLSVVFPLAPRLQFRSNFAAAVAVVLRDLGLPEAVARAESAAIEFEPLARLNNRSLCGKLNDVEFFCGIELGYHDDLGTVQLNLNEVPHAGLEPCVPSEAVRRLLEAAPLRGPSFAAH